MTLAHSHTQWSIGILACVSVFFATAEGGHAPLKRKVNTDMKTLVGYCRGHYPIGLYAFDEGLWTEDGVRGAAETGADFMMGHKSSEALLALCERHGLGALPGPVWWGGDGENAGGYAGHSPLETFDAMKKDCPSSAALWGNYPVDEPNSKDFAHINKVVRRYAELFPGKILYVNLYPNYASIAKNTEAQTVSQLGNASYQEHIEQYVREVDTPYISFDFYPFTGDFAFNRYLENLDIVARACRDSGREMWVITQAGAYQVEAMIDAYQVDWQIYLCLAYGAKAIIHACYTKGWWVEGTSCVNAKGEKGVMYDYVKEINDVLRSPLGAEFLKYDYAYTGACGDIASSDERMRPQLERQNHGEKPSGLPDIDIVSDKALIVGYFKNADGFAVMVVNAHNPFDPSVTANVKIGGITGAKAYHGNKSAGCVTASGVDLTLAGGQGAFVTFQY